MINFNTDLATERREIYKKANKLETEIPGIEAEEIDEGENIRKTIVKILDEQGEEAIGRPIGNYITIDFRSLRIADEDEIQKAAESLFKSLKELIDLHIGKEDEILVVGLGNRDVTPDALGPKVINDIDITRHLLKYAPEYLENNTRPVSAISPGVLGTTGIETAEMVKGIVQNVKPKLLIVIDSLAAKSIERISSTIQLADTGIAPGAGVGNKREELSINTIRYTSNSNRNTNSC